MLIFDQIKVYIYMAFGFIVMAFLAVFKYRGERIDSLETEVKQHEKKDKAQDFEKQNVEAAARAEAEDDKIINSDHYTI